MSLSDDADSFAFFRVTDASGKGDRFLLRRTFENKFEQVGRSLIDHQHIFIFSLSNSGELMNEREGY